MPRRSPIATAERIRVRVRLAARPATHFQPLVTLIARLGYFADADGQRSTATASSSPTTTTTATATAAASPRGTP